MLGPIRHCEPPHAHSPGVATVARRHCRTPPAHRCPRRRQQQRQRVTEGTTIWPHGMGPITALYIGYGILYCTLLTQILTCFRCQCLEAKSFEAKQLIPQLRHTSLDPTSSNRPSTPIAPAKYVMLLNCFHYAIRPNTIGSQRGRSRIT